MKERAEDSLGYWLFYAQRSWAYAFNEALHIWCREHQKPYVITPPQWGILSCLQTEDGLMVSMLSQRRAIDAPTITGIVNRLEQAGLVERVHDRMDRRVVRVYLSEEGKDVMRFLPAVVKTFSQTVLQGISEQQQREMCAFLQKTIVNLSAITPGAGDRFGLLPDYLKP